MAPALKHGAPQTLEELSVFVAMPCFGNPSLPTMMSLLDIQEECFKQGVNVKFGFVTATYVHDARSLLSHIFVERAKEHNRIFWIDADVKATGIDFMRLLVQSLKHDIVIGIYPRRADPPAFYVQFVDPDADPDPETGLCEVTHAGMGFACITRPVMEHMTALAPKLKHTADGEAFPTIFRMDDDGTAVRGEDNAFWADCREAGYKVYADATLKIGHVGTKLYQLP